MHIAYAYLTYPIWITFVKQVFSLIFEKIGLANANQTILQCSSYCILKQLLHSVEGKLAKATMLASWLILLLPGIVTSHSEKHMIGKTLLKVPLFVFLA